MTQVNGKSERSRWPKTCSARWAVLSASAISLSPMSTDAGDAHSEYRWKNRVIVFSIPEGKDGREVERQPDSILAKNREGIKDRDLVVIDVSRSRRAVIGVVRFSGVRNEAIRRRVSLGADDDMAQFILIGKDGGVKGRQSGDVGLEQFFALIDRMAMRRDEMRRKDSRK